MLSAIEIVMAEVLGPDDRRDEPSETMYSSVHMRLLDAYGIAQVVFKEKKGVPKELPSQCTSKDVCSLKYIVYGVFQSLYPFRYAIDKYLSLIQIVEGSWYTHYLGFLVR